MDWTTLDLTTLTSDDLEMLGVLVAAEQQRRRVLIHAEAQAAKLAAEYEQAAADLPPAETIPAAIGPGRRIMWQGEVWRNTSGGWLNSNALPDTFLQGWAQETGLPPDVAVWQPGEALAVDDLREYQGIVYRVIQAHTSQADWLPPDVPALYAPQGAPT